MYTPNGHGKSTPARTALLVLAIAATALTAVLALAPVTAVADSPVKLFTVGASSLQAGGHPDIQVEFKVGTSASAGYPDPCLCNDPKDIQVNMPKGFIGNPHAVPQCGNVEFALVECPPDTQVGIVALLLYKEFGVGGGAYFWQPLYNMVTRPDQAGLLAFQTPAAPGSPQYVVLKARTDSDYGLTVTNIGIERLFPIYGFTQWLWGVPADPIHNSLRMPKGFTTLECNSATENGDPRQGISENRYPSRSYECNNPGPGPLASNIPPEPFLSGPTACAGPLPATITTFSYDTGIAHGETTYPGVTGCDLLSFNPSLSAKPTTEEADAPSGADIDLTVPQLQSPSSPSPSSIRAVTVTLPEGFSLNPGAADGKTSCSDTEARFGTEEEAQCPEYSKIGTLTLDSSALPAPIPGYIYLGDPIPGNRYRLFITANGFATHVKLAGSVTPDPRTGQLVTSFPDLPESPLTEFNMHFFGSERGLLATPTKCGTYAVHSTFKPWDSALPDQDATQFFTIDSGPGGSPCPGSARPFTPGFTAASTGSTGGAFSPFSLELSRNDGDQNLSGLTVKTPPGFSASLRGIPYCSESAIASMSAPGYSGRTEEAYSACPAASQIGTLNAGAGPGSRPLHATGKTYLAGPYKGAPVSLVTVFPAIAGPYDLGTIAVRAALNVDPLTAQVTAVSDPLPLVYEGVPLRVRSLQIKLDRPKFTLNPTNCQPHSVDTKIAGEEGAVATPSTNFQVSNCATLPYQPKLSLRLKGGVNRRGHPAIHADLTASGGEANSKEVVVTLPSGELLDNSHIGTVCTRVDFAKNACPKASLLGDVTVSSPLLDKPLQGSIYLRSSQHQLPDLALDLEGQFDIEAVGMIDSVKGRLRTSFNSIPDVPFSKISLNLVGGAKGILQNTEDLCGTNKRATVSMVGQNGATTTSRVKLKPLCGANAKRKRHRGRAGKGR